MNEYLDQYKNVVTKKYAEFSGRAGRKEFWMFFVVNLAISVLLGLTRIQVLGILYALAVFVPSLAVAVRRLHDTNRSGWWLLISAVPVVGQIILIVFLAQKSKSAASIPPPMPAEQPPAEQPPPSASL